MCDTIKSHSITINKHADEISSLKNKNNDLEKHIQSLSDQIIDIQKFITSSK